MENRRFNFVGNINGKRKELIVHVPVENNGVYTNKYCPQDLLTGGVSFVGKIGVCCYSGLAERNAEYHVNSIFYRS